MSLLFRVIRLSFESAFSKEQLWRGARSVGILILVSSIALVSTLIPSIGPLVTVALGPLLVALVLWSLYYSLEAGLLDGLRSTEFRNLLALCFVGSILFISVAFLFSVVGVVLTIAFFDGGNPEEVSQFGTTIGFAGAVTSGVIVYSLVQFAEVHIVFSSAHWRDAIRVSIRTVRQNLLLLSILYSASRIVITVVGLLFVPAIVAGLAGPVVSTEILTGVVAGAFLLALVPVATVNTQMQKKMYTAVVSDGA